MPLYVQDEVTATLVSELASLKGVSEQEAVRLAVQAELDRLAASIPLRDRLAAMRASNPLPPHTGKFADKPFFDELSGDV